MDFTTLPDVVYGHKFGMGLFMEVVTPAKPSGVGVLALSSGGWKSWPEMGKPDVVEFLKRGQTVFVVSHGGRPRFSIGEIVGDIRRAVRFVRANAVRFGVDPQRLGLFGISSGGNVSLLTASQAGDGQADAKDEVDRHSDRVGAVACFYPPTDLTNFGEPGKVWLPYRLAEETGDDSELAKTYSPVTHFTPAMPPTLIMHGDKDELVPLQQAHVAIGRLKELGVANEFVFRPGKGHGWPGMTDEFATCAAWLDRWLTR